MSDTILVAIDDSEPAREALAHAVDLAERLEVPLHVLTVVDVTDDPMRFGVDEVDAINRAAATLRDAVVDAVDGRDVEVHTEVRRGRPHEVVGAYAEAIDAVLILVGRRGASDLPEAILGSTTDRLVRTSSIPVAVVPDAGVPTEHRSTDDPDEPVP